MQSSSKKRSVNDTRKIRVRTPVIHGFSSMLSLIRDTKPATLSRPRLVVERHLAFIPHSSVSTILLSSLRDSTTVDDEIPSEARSHESEALSSTEGDNTPEARLLDWFKTGGEVGIYDATNAERSRRDMIREACSAAGVRVLFVETICDDPTVIDANVRRNKLGLADYAGVTAEGGYDSNVFYDDTPGNKYHSSLLRITPFAEITNTARSGEDAHRSCRRCRDVHTLAAIARPLRPGRDAAGAGRLPELLSSQKK